MGILSGIIIALSVIGIAFGISIIAYNVNFSKKSVQAVGQVTGTRGKKFLVHFKYKKRVIVASALAFGKNIYVKGNTVYLRLLESRKSPQKWDIRILGPAGDGSKKLSRIAYAVIAGSVCLLIVGILLVWRNEKTVGCTM